MNNLDEFNIPPLPWTIQSTRRRSSKDRYDVLSQGHYIVAQYVIEDVARLIAAAPALYEALEAYTEAMKDPIKADFDKLALDGFKALALAREES